MLDRAEIANSDIAGPKAELEFGAPVAVSRYCPRIADGPRPQHVGPLGRTAKSQCFCALPCAANRDGSRSAGGSVKMHPLPRRAGKPPLSIKDWATYR